MSQTGHLHVGFFSFILRYKPESKHLILLFTKMSFIDNFTWRCLHLLVLVGTVILEHPTGQSNLTLSEVVATSELGSSFSFTIRMVSSRGIVDFRTRESKMSEFICSPSSRDIPQHFPWLPSSFHCAQTVISI